MKLLQREALEAKAVGGASTVKEERKPRPVVSLTARSEPYNRAVLHASRLGKGANAPVLQFWKTMWPRETTARSGDIEGAIGSPPAKPMSSGFAAESIVVYSAAKNTKSLAARAGGCGVGSQPMPSANAMWDTNGRVLVSNVAAWRR